MIPSGPLTACGCLLEHSAAERRKMVDGQLRGAAFGTSACSPPCWRFPAKSSAARSPRFPYADHPIPIGHGQTVSQPYMTALMAESLELTGAEMVLEIGAGSGYAAAVLGALAARVVSIEIVPALADLARENLRRAGRDANVTVACGDGSMGYPDLAPYCCDLRGRRRARNPRRAARTVARTPAGWSFPWAGGDARNCACWSRATAGSAAASPPRASSFRFAAAMGGAKCACAPPRTASRSSTA